MIAVVSLVIVFAGPGVASAIRNQFNTVTNTVDGGTSGDAFISAEEKAYREAMKTVTQKDAKDWTLAEQKAAATDISKNGTSSVVYAKAKAAMDAGTTWSVKLTDGKTMNYKIIGINHDDLADGSGKAGLTFMAASINIYSRFNATDDNTGGWEKSELRQKMNSGEIWNLLPADFQSDVKVVTKLTNNVGGGYENKNAAVTATTDKLFCLSSSEVVDKTWYNYADIAWIGSEGTQYEAFKGKVPNSNGTNPSLASDYDWWLRTVSATTVSGGVYVHRNGNPRYGTYCNDRQDVLPAFCF